MEELQKQLGALLLQIRKERGWTLLDLSDATLGRINAGNWSVVERGQRTPNIWHLISWCEVMGFQLGDLLERARNQDADIKQTIPGKILEPQRVPLLSWVQAGCWSESIPADPASAKMIPAPIRTTKSAFALEVRGDSMTAMVGPSFPDGYLLIVEPKRQADHKSFVIARENGSDNCTFKQLIIDGNKKYLKPLNTQYSAFEINESTEICGIVVAAFKEF
ncbi:helix-turn-helix domain-containing protein [Pokkaliibacter sp. CJK22405]|uniref:helix-turn-helix domain-containing protein n=1 Tax=Pokkaliibacter sp. CJK22405 TaxID=3384615 RepID=UPI003985131B